MAGAAVQRIAVVGAGRAGRARMRAIAEHPGAELVGVARREPGPGERTLDAVLADPAVDALIVCTPNLLHAAAARAALEVGKHVAVEFPLAASAAEARALFELARARQRVLHVEHIELLSPSQRHLRAAAAGLGPPVGGELRFTGGSEGWIGQGELAGGPGLRALARLSRLVDLFGPAAVAQRRVEPLSQGYRLEVELRFAAGGAVLLVEQRAPGLARALVWEIECERGWLPAPPAEPASGLFARDLEVFLRRIARGEPSYIPEARVVHLLELVDAIDRGSYPADRNAR
jgi:biliverdin reductase